MSTKLRVGIGEDIHRLVERKSLVLGGVKIPFEKGCLAHSDGDVIYHALSDSLLGALALGDIGIYFPPKDPKYDNVDSSLIVSTCYQMIKDKGYGVVNVDITVCCEKPHLKQYVNQIRSNIAKLLEIDIDCVGIQAMSNEGLDAIGKGEAIKANAICLLEAK